MLQTDEKYDTDEAAKYLRMEPHTLDTWRSNKRYALPYIKVGRKVLYLKSDLDAWLASRRVVATEGA